MTWVKLIEQYRPFVRNFPDYSMIDACVIFCNMNYPEKTMQGVSCSCYSENMKRVYDLSQCKKSSHVQFYQSFDDD